MVRTHADDDNDRKLLTDIANHGWHIVGIKDDPGAPAYAFSVGLFHTLGQPEVCIFGLDSTSTMGQIINQVGSLMKTGETFEDWHESDDVLDGYSMMFRQVDQQHYAEHFGYARWFYEGDDFPMLQCVWPDHQHKFPWDSQFESELIACQPVLAMQAAWRFSEGKNRAVITTKFVVDEGHPILLVTHDEDGDWQFLCGSTNEPADGRLVSLGSAVAEHPALAELADLPVGWQAEREEAGQPWQRSQMDE